MERLYLLLVMTLFCSTFVFALDFSVNGSSDTMIRGVDNSVSLTLSGSEAESGYYNLYTLSDLIITPLDQFYVNGSTFYKVFDLRARSSFDTEGKYAFTYTLNQRGVKKYDKRGIINFVNLDDAISIYSDSIDSDSTQVSFYVENKLPVEIKNLTGKFSSVLFNAEKTFNLGPNEKKEIFVYANVDKLKKTKAGVYLIEGVFETSYGEVEVDGNLYLGEKKGITSTEDKSGLIVRTQTITKVNAGNVVEDVRIQMSQDIFSRFFTTFNIEPSIIERDGSRVRYTWEKSRLDPAEAYTVRARTNYFLPILILAFIIVGLVALKRYTDMKLEVKKTVSPVRTKGGEFALKVHLNLKARSNIENVKLSDRVPAMVRIHNKFTPVNPDKIDSRTRRLHWNIGDLISGEVRAFDYVVYSKVGIIGKFVLPEARGTFEKDNKISEVSSNKVFFMNDQVDRD